MHNKSDHEKDHEEEEERPDPFAKFASDHPAIGVVRISPDVYKDLFNSSFRSEMFQRWLCRKNSWQLHCHGGPGSGKTIFAALAVERIRDYYAASITKTTHVASLFVRDMTIENELIFVEDSIRHIYEQLSPMSVVAGLMSTKCYSRYTIAREKGRRIAVRIERIAHALQQRLHEIAQSGRAFVVIDNLDQCTPTVVELLERELSSLQKLKLGILMTSRLPKHEKLEDAWCDFHEREPWDVKLQFFWRCSSCETHYMCERETCYNLDRVCSQCVEETSWAEPEHMNMPLSNLSMETTRNFVAWDLEREHGDLDLGSTAVKPPLSSFGSSFRKAGLDRHWIDQFYPYTDGSVVQTKLALDRIHTASSPEAVDPLPNRMPANVQALYHNGLKAIKQQSSSQGELAMKSIAAVCKKPKTEEGFPSESGLPVNILADLVRRQPRTKSRVPLRSIEDILIATRGYLRLNAPGYEQKDYHVAAFDRRFFWFVSQDYSDELIMANALLRTSNIPRSLTRGLFELPRDVPTASAVSRQEVMKELKDFESPKLPASLVQKRPLPRRGSSGVKRSKTLISFDLPKPTTPPAGLGLRF